MASFSFRKRLKIDKNACQEIYGLLNNQHFVCSSDLHDWTLSVNIWPGPMLLVGSIFKSLECVLHILEILVF